MNDCAVVQYSSIACAVYIALMLGISSRFHVNHCAIISFTLHAMFKGRMNSLLWVWPMGVVNTKATIVALVASAA